MLQQVAQIYRVLLQLPRPGIRNKSAYNGTSHLCTVAAQHHPQIFSEFESVVEEQEGQRQVCLLLFDKQRILCIE